MGAKNYFSDEKMERGNHFILQTINEQIFKCVVKMHRLSKRFNLNGQEVPRVSPAGSVGASAFGRGVHRTPAPSKAVG